jgi:hypothetical protein
MTIGSPALAGYSLAITRLNGRWLARRFSYLHFPNKDHIPLVVSTLQHIPFTIDASGPLLPSLIVLPQNDRYWKVLGAAAKRTRQLSIPVAMNIIWTIVAFVFTIVDSFMSSDGSVTDPGDAGYSIAAVWIYLLPLVVGWLHVGSQPEADHLRNALEEAQGIAYVATTTEPVLATRVTEATGRSTRAIELRRNTSATSMLTRRGPLQFLIPLGFSSGPSTPSTFCSFTKTRPPMRIGGFLFGAEQGV